MTLGHGYLQLLEQASAAIFPERSFALTDEGRVVANGRPMHSLGDDVTSASVAGQRGAWLGHLAAGLQLLAKNAIGTGRETGKRGKRSSLQLMGFNDSNRNALLVWARGQFGATSGALRQRQQSGDAVPHTRSRPANRIPGPPPPPGKKRRRAR